MSVSVRFECAVTIVAAALIAAAVAGCAAGGGATEQGVDASAPADGNRPVDGPAVTPPDAPPPDGSPPDGPPPDGPLAACSPAELAPGADEVIALDHDGRSRQYNVHVGTSVDPSRPAPLMLNFHGMNNTAGLQELFSRMKAVADAEGFVVVYPSGLSNSFNAGSCCGTSASRDVDDIGFTRAIVADVSDRVCIDPRRVYATGFSNGGYMAHYLACHASDLFAAVAPVSGAIGTASCDPGRAVPVIAFHGTADFVVPYSSGQSAAAQWRQHNGCSSASDRESFGSSYCEAWSDCDGGTAVTFCSIAGGSHLWPGAASSIPASPRIWEFVSQYQLPEDPAASEIHPGDRALATSSTRE
jgi:polyhydroxybutyrate depolymerase